MSTPAAKRTPPRCRASTSASLRTSGTTTRPPGTSASRFQLLEPTTRSSLLKITDHLVNGHGTVHGGYIFTLADTTFAYACNSRGLTTVAAGVDITFVQAAYLGDVLIADARVRANWGRSGITDVTVIRESDGASVAEFRGRSRQIPPKATPTALA